MKLMNAQTKVNVTLAPPSFSLGVVRPASQWPLTYRHVPQLLWTRSSLRTTEKGRNRTTLPAAPVLTTRLAPTDTPTSAHLFPQGKRILDKEALSLTCIVMASALSPNIALAVLLKTFQIVPNWSCLISLKITGPSQKLHLDISWSVPA